MFSTVKPAGRLQILYAFFVMVILRVGGAAPPLDVPLYKGLYIASTPFFIIMELFFGAGPVVGGGQGPHLVKLDKFCIGHHMFCKTLSMNFRPSRYHFATIYMVCSDNPALSNNLCNPLPNEKPYPL